MGGVELNTRLFVVKPNLSWSHPWATAPVSLVMRVLLGIRPTGPGYSSLEVSPQPAGLCWAEGAVPTVRGGVAASFNCSGDGCAGGDGGTVQVRATFPPSTNARVCAPLMGSKDCNVTVASSAAAWPVARALGSQSVCGQVELARGRVCVDVDPQMWTGVVVSRTVS